MNENKYCDCDAFDDIDAVAHRLKLDYPEISLTDAFKIAIGIVQTEDNRNK